MCVRTGTPSLVIEAEVLERWASQPAWVNGAIRTSCVTGSEFFMMETGMVTGPKAMGTDGIRVGAVGKRDEQLFMGCRGDVSLIGV